MGPAPLEKAKFKTFWPARVATEQEALEFRKMHGLWGRKEEQMVVLVFLCVGGHHVLTSVKQDACRRVTLEELDYMVDLWFNGGEKLQAGVTLGQPLRTTQLGLEFVAGLLYAQAFARLGREDVSVERPVRNEARVTAFTARQLNNPWEACFVEDAAHEKVYAQDFPGLRDCDQCFASQQDCTAPEILGMALHYLKHRVEYALPHPLPVQHGAMRAEEGPCVGKRKFQEHPASLDTDRIADMENAYMSSQAAETKYRDVSTASDSIFLPSAAASLDQACQKMGTFSCSLLSSSAQTPSTHGTKARKGKERRTHRSVAARPPPSPLLSPPRSIPLPCVEEPPNLDAAVSSFRCAWSTLRSQASSLATNAPACWTEEPVSVKAVESVVLPQLLARCEAKELDVDRDLTFAHQVVRHAVEEIRGLGLKVRRAKRNEMDKIKADFRRALVDIGTEAYAGLVAFEQGAAARDVMILVLEQKEEDAAQVHRKFFKDNQTNDGEGPTIGVEKGCVHGETKDHAKHHTANLKADLMQMKELLSNLVSSTGKLVMRQTVASYELKLREALTLDERTSHDLQPLLGNQDARATPETIEASNGSLEEKEWLAERLTPLVERLENVESLALAHDAQLDDAVRLCIVQWGALRCQLLRHGVLGRGGKKKTLLLYDIRCANHKVPEAHVEQPQRFLHAAAAMRQLMQSNPEAFALQTEITADYFPLWRGPQEGYRDEILRVHTAAHLDGIRIRCEAAGSDITRLSAPPRVAAATVRVQAWLNKHKNGSVGPNADASSSSRPLLRSTATDSSSSAPLLGVGLGESAPGHLYHHPFLITQSPRKAASGGEKEKEEVDGDTFGNKESFVAASVGFAGTLQAVDAVIQGRAGNAFVACRPPGHHVGRNGKPILDCVADEKAQDVGWGFCFLNYVAGAALHAVERWGLSRVSVVDIDLHHGNGTEEILSLHRNTAFQFISVHAAGIFPYTGEASRARWPRVVNLPLSPPLTPHKYRKVWCKVDEAVDAFGPELILLSAGHDAHWNDPIGSKEFVGGGKNTVAPIGRLSSDDYFDIVSRVVNLANRHSMGRLVAVMEGGYCCRPPNTRSARAASSAGTSRYFQDHEEAVDGGEYDAIDPATVESETVRDCVAATCRALAGIACRDEHRVEEATIRPKDKKQIDMGVAVGLYGIPSASSFSV